MVGSGAPGLGLERRQESRFGRHNGREALADGFSL